MGLRESERLEAMQALKSAVRTWNNALSSVGPKSSPAQPGVRVVVDEDAAEPDVQIEFSRVAYTAGQPVAGSIRWQDSAHRVGGKYVPGRTIVLTLGTLSSLGQQNPASRIANTLAHKIGHVLGLSDLPNTGGVMDLETPSDRLRSVNGDDLAELTSVLSGRDQATCRSMPDGRWIY